MSILSKTAQFVKIRESDIILGVAVILISFLSFATGYLVAKERLKEPISIEQNTNEEQSINE